MSGLLYFRNSNVTRFIIHIGPHKTGTTYLQVTLDAMRDRLFERGIGVPAIWNAAPGIPSHMQLVWALRSGKLALIQQQLQEMASQRHHTVVVSCEALSRLNQEQIVQLRWLLGPAPIQLVYYIRRWPERLASLWQETVKFGHTATLTEFLSEQLTGYDQSELRDASIIDRFAAVFGAARIKLVSYSHLVDQGLDIARHFLSSFLGLSDIKLPVSSILNRSLPIFDTELIRTLNVIHVRNGGEPSPTLREWYLAHGGKLVPDTIRQIMRDKRGTLHLNEAAPPFAPAIHDLLARYGSCVVPPYQSGGLHEVQTVDAPFIRQDYLLKPGVTEMLRDIYEMYRRTR